MPWYPFYSYHYFLALYCENQMIIRYSLREITCCKIIKKNVIEHANNIIVEESSSPIQLQHLTSEMVNDSNFEISKYNTL